MWYSKVFLLYCVVLGVVAQTSTTETSEKTTTTTNTKSSKTESATTTEATVPTGSYLSLTTTIVLTSSSLGTMSVSTSLTESENSTSTETGSDTTKTKTTQSQTVLSGTNHVSSTTTAINGTATGNSTATTSTSSTVQPTNTTPCNGYAELCDRAYGNITEVCAHNSPFIKAGNAAANQALDVTTQLNDGIRMLQAQTHLVNGTLYLCHTSCDILNAGPLVDYLTTVNTWVEAHPYDVVTILIGNGDYNWINNFTAPFEESGLTNYAYLPPKIPMGVNDWPTLSEMILSGKRVVIFMDYMADQGLVNYILDEFTQMWETPFDPTNQSFPCYVQRPPDLADDKANDRMYMTNHNLNADITLLGTELLVPATTLLNVTNNVTGFGSLGVGAETCYQMWGRPPNRLNVDFYEVGDGSVFEVAAKWNNVTYNGKCCGSTSDARKLSSRGAILLGMGAWMAWMLL